MNIDASDVVGGFVKSCRKQTVCNPTVMRRSRITCHAVALSLTLNRKLTIIPVMGNFADDHEEDLMHSCKPPTWV